MHRERKHQRDIRQEQVVYSRHKDRLLAEAKKGSFKAFKQLHNKLWSRDPVDLGLAWEAFKKKYGITTAKNQTDSPRAISKNRRAKRKP